MNAQQIQLTQSNTCTFHVKVEHLLFLSYPKCSIKHDEQFK